MKGTEIYNKHIANPGGWTLFHMMEDAKRENPCGAYSLRFARFFSKHHTLISFN
jgi:hypothetical protein